MRALKLWDQRFGRLIALERTRTKQKGNLRWLCRCDCWNYTITTGARLVSGHTQSCGCIRTEYARKMGKKYRYLITPGNNQHTRRARNQSLLETCTGNLRHPETV